MFAFESRASRDRFAANGCPVERPRGTRSHASLRVWPERLPQFPDFDKLGHVAAECVACTVPLFPAPQPKRDRALYQNHSTGLYWSSIRAPANKKTRPEDGLRDGGRVNVKSSGMSASCLVNKRQSAKPASSRAGAVSLISAFGPSPAIAAVRWPLTMVPVAASQPSYPSVR
jgi:hypothetical protein